MRTNELMLYKNMEYGEILKDITFLIDNYESEFYNKEDLRGLLFDCINELLELSVSHGFEGNLWHTYLTFLLASDENAYSTSCEIVGEIEGSLNEIALHDFAIFKEMFDYDFEELENVLLQSDLAEKIVNEFHTPNKRSIVPAMLAWLYYGRSYECMVEQGEELTKRKDIPTLYKWLVSGMVKFIIRKSIANGMRTKEDWQVFRKQQKAIEENSLVEWAIEEDEDMDEEETDMLQEEQPKTAGRKADTRTLPELLIERHDILIERIGTRLKTHATETDIARLFIALVEYRFMRKCPIKTFRNALYEQFKEQEIVHERGIQKAYRNLTSPFGNSKKLVKDIGEDHEAIEELKAYLSN